MESVPTLTLPAFQRASIVTADTIREAIRDGVLAPGQRLKEAELARMFGISRTPIREALLILQAEGMVDAAPNRGASVRIHSAEDLDDLYRLRALLEGYATRLAAGRFTPEQLAKLSASCDRFDALCDLSDDEGDSLRTMVQENLDFHSTISEASGSTRLASMLRDLMDLPLVYKSYTWYSADQKRISAHYHRQILTALEAHDGERAELVMRQHVYEARDVVVAHARDLERVE